MLESCLKVGGRETGEPTCFTCHINNGISFPGRQLQLENGPKLEQKHIYLHILPPTKKVVVLTSSATNINIRLNHMKLLIFDHARPVKNSGFIWVNLTL